MFYPSPECKNKASYVVPSLESILEVVRYAKWAKAGQEYVDTIGCLPSLWDQFLDWYEQHVDLPRILDVGCGSGYMSFLLAQNGAHVVGIDPVIGSEKERYHHKNLHIEQAYLEPVVREEIHNLDLEDILTKNVQKSGYKDTFDLVFNSWMPYGINLTPAIRSLGAKGIFYVLSPRGGTGISFGEFGCCDSFDFDTQETILNNDKARKMILSFQPGDGYEDYFSYRYDAITTAGFGARARVQFQQKIPFPYFELTEKRAREKEELAHLKGINLDILNLSSEEAREYIPLSDVQILTQQHHSQLPYTILKRTGTNKYYQLFDFFTTEKINSISSQIITNYIVRQLSSIETERVRRVVEKEYISKIVI